MDGVGDFGLLTDEKFDFDISMSPTSAKEDEDCDDEVFIGPVKHKEKCIRAAIASQESDEMTPPHVIEMSAWSPLSGEKFVEIFKEAHLLALQLESFACDDQKKEQAPQPAPNQAVEKFVQESKSKLKLFEAGLQCSKTPVVVKRETYCVQDSPFHQLPPSVQKRLAVPGTDDGKMSGAESPKQDSPGRSQKPTKTISVSPLVQKGKTLQSKSNFPAVNLSKPAVSRMPNTKAFPTNLQKNLLMVEKPKMSAKRSPVRRKHLSSADSFEDLHSDKSSYASDVSDTSFNNSVVGQNKRTLPAPNKANMKRTEFKAPAYGVFRKNTSSSSSSHSSLNTSLNSSSAFSPPFAGAKLNVSLNTSINGSKLKAIPSRLALVRPIGGSMSSLKTNTDSSNNPRPLGGLKSKAVVGNNKSSVAPMAGPQSPASKFLRQTSAPNLRRLPPQGKPDSANKGAPGTKPQARVFPTPTSRLKLPLRPGGVSPENSASKATEPTRLLSCEEIGSVNVEITPLSDEPGAQPSFGKFATPSANRVSALPTPNSQRPPGVFTTPRTIPRSFGFVRQTPATQTKSAAKLLVTRNGECDRKPPAPISPPSSADEEASTLEIVPCSLNFSPESKESAEQREIQLSLPAPITSEALLIDIGLENNRYDTTARKPSLIEFDSQPLIDLSNTPDVNKRAGPTKPAYVGQLIDLSSPLIKLSPGLNKENVAFDFPLLKF